MSFRKSLIVAQKPKLKETHGQNSEENKSNKSQEDNRKNQTRRKIDYIQKFVKEQRKNVYVNMQSHDLSTQTDAIKKWDRIEILLEKISENAEDTGYIETLYGRIVELNNKQKGLDR